MVIAYHKSQSYGVAFIEKVSFGHVKGGGWGSVTNQLSQK